MAAYMENVILCLTSDFCGKANDLKDIRNVLQKFNHLLLLKERKPGSIQDFVSHIHNCLNSAKQRLEGLLLLDKLVEQCVTDVFIQNALVWLRFIIQILQSHDPVYVQKLACHVCCRILDHASSFTVLSRDVTSLIPQLIPLLLSSTPKWRDEALTCITACIENFHGSCGPFKNKIENLVVQELDGETASKSAVKCYAVLARCGGSGNLGVKHTEGWSQQCNKLLGSIEKTINELYEGLDIPLSLEPTRHSSYLSLCVAPESHSERLNFLTSRFQTLTFFLQTLLREPFSAVAKVPVYDIIELMYQALSVNSKILDKRTTTERTFLFTLLPSIHIAAVAVVGALIHSCKNLLLPYTKQILSMLVQELMWTKSPVHYGQCRPYSAVRECVYDTLTTWLQNVGVFVETTTEEEDLIDAILHDARPHVDTVKIDKKGGKLSNGTEPPPAKKKKKGGYHEISHGISTQKKIDTTADYNLTTASLNALYWLLTTVGETLKVKSVKEVQEFVISTSLSINQQRNNPRIPYHHSNCRHGIYKVLQACVLVPHPVAPSPLRCILAIFRMGLQDQDSMVSSYCKESMRICEALIHPRAPCLKGPIICSSSINIADKTCSTLNSETYVQSEQELISSHPSNSEESTEPRAGGSREWSIESKLTEGSSLVSKDSNSQMVSDSFSYTMQLNRNAGSGKSVTKTIQSTDILEKQTDNISLENSADVLNSEVENRPENTINVDLESNNVNDHCNIAISNMSDRTDIINKDNAIDEINLKKKTVINEEDFTGVADSGQEVGRDTDQQLESCELMDTDTSQQNQEDEDLHEMLSTFKDTDPDK